MGYLYIAPLHLSEAHITQIVPQMGSPTKGARQVTLDSSASRQTSEPQNTRILSAGMIVKCWLFRVQTSNVQFVTFEEDQQESYFVWKSPYWWPRHCCFVSKMGIWWGDQEILWRSSKMALKWQFNEDGHYLTFVDKKTGKNQEGPLLMEKKWFQILEASLPK